VSVAALRRTATWFPFSQPRPAGSRQRTCANNFLHLLRATGTARRHERVRMRAKAARSHRLFSSRSVSSMPMACYWQWPRPALLLTPGAGMQRDQHPLHWPDSRIERSSTIGGPPAVDQSQWHGICIDHPFTGCRGPTDLSSRT
jgi:hypothetical protein